MWSWLPVTDINDLVCEEGYKIGRVRSSVFMLSFELTDLDFDFLHVYVS